MNQRPVLTIKLGGSILQQMDLVRSLARELRKIQQFPMDLVLTHGGGAEIDKNLALHQIERVFKDGLRVTDARTMEIVESTLVTTNSQLLNRFLQEGLPVVGLSGKSGGLAWAKQLAPAYGFVGEIIEICPQLILKLCEAGFIPLLAPISLGQDYNSYNLNADSFTAALAGALKAEWVIFVTDVEAIRLSGKNVERIDAATIEQAIAQGEIQGGMIPKARSLLEAQQAGAKRATILSAQSLVNLAEQLRQQRLAGTTLQA